MATIYAVTQRVYTAGAGVRTRCWLEDGRVVGSMVLTDPLNTIMRDMSGDTMSGRMIGADEQQLIAAGFEPSGYQRVYRDALSREYASDGGSFWPLDPESDAPDLDAGDVEIVKIGYDADAAEE